jgi:hypothetical protein
MRSPSPQHRWCPPDRIAVVGGDAMLRKWSEANKRWLGGSTASLIARADEVTE